LASVVDSPALRSYFSRMAKKWSKLAASGLEHEYGGQELN
jgi:hypothetical protein